MKKILINATLLLLEVAFVVIVTMVYMTRHESAKTFNQSDFTIGQIEMVDKVFCSHTLGEFDKEQNFKPLFKVTTRCGIWSAGDKVMLVKNTAMAEPLKKEGMKK